MTTKKLLDKLKTPNNGENIMKLYRYTAKERGALR